MRRTVRRLLVIGAIGALAAGLLAAGLGSVTDAWRLVLAPGPASLDQLGAAAAGTAAAALAGWLALALVAASLSALCAGPGRSPRTGRVAELSTRMAPAALRRLVAALLGAGIVLGGVSPALATTGSAGRPPARTAAPAPTAAAQADGDLDPTWAGGRTGPTASAAASSAGRRLRRPRRPLPSPTASAATGSSPAASRPGRTGRGPAARSDRARAGRPRGRGAARRHPLGPRRPVDSDRARARPRSRPSGRDWYAANRAVIGADPDHLEPGQRLRIPGAGSTSPTAGADR